MPASRNPERCSWEPQQSRPAGAATPRDNGQGAHGRAGWRRGLLTIATPGILGREVGHPPDQP